jgi:hypothetical protein
MNHQTELNQVIHFFESISPESTSMITTLYSDDAYFKDPFNEVRSSADITTIFQHMFKQVEAPKFVVTQRILQGDDAFIVWEFHFQMKQKSSSPQCIHGSSHLRFDRDHRINYHRDYWDVAEELYEKIPVLGCLMRFIKRIARS